MFLRGLKLTTFFNVCLEVARLQMVKDLADRSEGREFQPRGGRMECWSDEGKGVFNNPGPDPTV